MLWGIILWAGLLSNYCQALKAAEVYSVDCDVNVVAAIADYQKQDVPAIEVPVKEKYCSYGGGSGPFETCYRYDYLERTRWTCMDQSRILLTAEDGTKHCIKFNAN